jgi:hypothetical protein
MLLMGAVLRGDPFEEPFLVSGRTLFSPMQSPSNRGFYMKPKRVLPGTKKGIYLESIRVLLWGQPKNPFGTLFSKRVILKGNDRWSRWRGDCYRWTQRL